MKTKICSKSGCQRTAIEGKNYCNKHISLENQRHQIFKNTKRKQSNQWHYLYSSARWRKTSKDFLEKYTICFICGNKATVADHIIAHRGNLELFYDETNLQPLCARCHARKTLAENNYFKKEQ